MNVDRQTRFSKGYYDSVAWFEHTKLFVGEMTFSFQKLSPLISPKDRPVILDCGCGFGGAKPFIDRFFPTRAYPIPLSPNLHRNHTYATE